MSITYAQINKDKAKTDNDTVARQARFWLDLFQRIREQERKRS